MKKIQRWQKYWKSLAWLGPILILLGCLAASISGKFGPLPLSILVTGVMLFGLWLLFQGQLIEEQQAKQWWGRRSTQVGTNAIAATLSVLIILGLINFLAVRYPTRIDLTENQLFTLAPQSQQVVQSLDQPVKLWIFDRAPRPIDRELLNNYRRQGKQFSFEYVDPDRDRILTQKFGARSAGDVYLEAGDRKQFLQNIQFERLSEAKLTAGLEQITSNLQSKIYFFQGHGERPLSDTEGGLARAVESLEAKNYLSEPLSLAGQGGKIPKDAAVAIVAGPKQALFEAEVKALQQYLQQGGGVLLLLDPETDPGVNKLLQGWGVRLDDRLAINLSNQQIVGLGPTAILVDRYGNHPITQDFGNNYSFYRQARPLEVKEVEGTKATPLLLTNDSTWAVDLEARQDAQQLELDPSRDLQGPLTLGVALSRPLQSQPDNKSESTDPESSKPDAPKPETTPGEDPTPSPSPAVSPEPKTEKTPKEARLVVVGNSSFAADGFFDQQLNGDVFLNAVGWLSQRNDRSLSIRPKEVKDRRIIMNPQQSRLLGWLSMAILPLVGFGTAFAAWWWRR